MTDSLALDRTTWDLLSDAAGNIATVTPPYSTAQDVACAIRLFQGELWYDTTKGVPYFSQILGQAPPTAFIKSSLVTAALTVPDVATAKAFLQRVSGRQVQGQVQVTDINGVTTAVTTG